MNNNFNIYIIQNIFYNIYFKSPIYIYPSFKDYLNKMLEDKKEKKDYLFSIAVIAIVGIVAIVLGVSAIKKTSITSLPSETLEMAETSEEVNLAGEAASTTQQTPPITVVYPNYGGYFEKGQNLPIQFLHTCQLKTFTIDLIKSGSLPVRRIASNVKPRPCIGVSTYTYNWIIPKNLAEGFDYRIRVSSVASTPRGKVTVFDESDYPFAIFNSTDCIDSDGLDYFTKGTVTSGIWGTSVDTCYSPDYLIEYYCNDIYVSSQWVYCREYENGVCKDGACVIPIRRNTPPVIIEVGKVPKPVVVGQEVNFWWRATDEDNDDLAWSVDFGDGTGGGAVCEGKPVPRVLTNPTSVPTTPCGWNFSVSHSWENPGEYVVNAEVSDGKGGSDNSLITIFVE